MGTTSKTPVQEWWTPKDLARRWGWHEKTIRNKINAGFIQGEKLAGSTQHRVRWGEVERIENKAKG